MGNSKGEAHFLFDNLYNCNMVNSLHVVVMDRLGVERDMVVEALHEDPKGYGFQYTNDYRVFINEDAETEDVIEMGLLHFSPDKMHWVYDGDQLTIHEQEQIAEIILTYGSGL
jgi:hypothetical protein